jgi:maleate cis-trans isomerase
MFEEFQPKVKIGALKPLAVIDNAAYEFYRIAPADVMLVMIPIGLGEFSREDVERVFAPIDDLVDQLMERGVQIIMQSGVPLPLLIGVEAHDRLLDRIAKRSNLPTTSSVLGVVAAAKHLGLRQIAGVASEVLTPAQFQKISTADNMALAYELGRAALTRFPDADGLYIGGGAWLSEPVCQALEREFGKPAISNQSCLIWDNLTRLNQWRPLPGQGILLSSP